MCSMLPALILLYIIESTSFGTKKRSFYVRKENSEEDKEALLVMI